MTSKPTQPSRTLPPSTSTLLFRDDPLGAAVADLSRRRLLKGAGALLAGAATPFMFTGEAFALTEATPITLQGAKPGGTLTAVLHPEPPTLAFFVNTATMIGAVASKIFDGLVEYGPDLKPRPQLAQSWTVSPDGLTWTFKLRPNVTWHDGKPFTSADVKFSAEEIWLKISPVTRRVLQYLTKIDAPDAHTVVLHLAKSTPATFGVLDGLSTPILPRHLYENTDIRNNPYNNKPVGTGPFVFKEWLRGDRIVLERNDRYWSPGQPYLDRLTWKITPDVSGRATALETGAAQYGERNPVTFADADRLAGLPNLVVSREGYNGYAAWLWLEPNLRDPILAKREVRQAIAHAINRDLLVRTVWGGYAVPATGPESSLVKAFYTPDTQQYPYDPKKAEALLDQAGFPKKADGWRFAINHDFIPYGDDYRRTGEFVRQALRRVGIDVTLRGQDLPTWIKNVFTDYDFQLISTWGTVGLDPQIGIEQHYWSKAEAKGTPWYNASGYASPEMDRVIEAAQTETDPAKRRELYFQLQKIAQRDLSLINLFEFRWFGVWSRTLRNVTDTSSHSRSNFARVWFDKA